MKTDKNLKEFIEQVKNTSPEIPADTVKSLINSGKPSPFVAKRSFHPRRIKQFFNPLRILIMITPIVIITSALLIWNPIIKEDEKFLEKAKFTETVSPNIESTAIQNTQVRETKKIAVNEQKDTGKENPEQPPKDLGLKAANDVLSPTDTSKKTTSPTLDKSMPKIISKEQNVSILEIKTTKSDLVAKGIGVKTIELDSATMSCIGFDIGIHSIEILWQGPDQYDRTIRLEESKGKSLLNGTGHKYKRRTPSEWATYGLKPIQFIAISSYGGEKPADPNNPIGSQSETASFDKLLNISIPIALKGHDSTEVFSKCIFWLVPTEELIGCLPDSIAGPMRMEFRKNVKPILMDLAIKDGKPVDIDAMKYAIPVEDIANPVPCRYFPSFCEGLPGLNDLRVYPIPTSDFLSIEIHLVQSKKITYRIFDITGRLLNHELPTKDYTEPGQYTEKMDLSGLNSGLYLLVLTDDQGARMTRRILKN
jgi:hypothetical protein